MVHELKIEQTIYRVSEILFEGILVDLFNDDNPLSHSPYLRKNSVRLPGMMQHCNEQGDVETVVIKGDHRAVVDDGLDLINKTEILDIQWNDVIPALAELLAENTVPGAYVKNTISGVKMGEYLLEFLLHTPGGQAM